MSKTLKDNQPVTAIILAGARDFGRNTLTSCLPTVLWPLMDETVLKRLLDYLSDQGISDVVICSSGDVELLRDSLDTDTDMKLKFTSEHLPLGTAGCVREAITEDPTGIFLVFNGALISPPEVAELLKSHQQAGADLTVALNPNNQTGALEGEAAGIYVCNSSILECMPKEGYCDIKETLIPNMVRAGKNVHAVWLSESLGGFRNRMEYLSAVSEYLEKLSNHKSAPALNNGRQNQSNLVSKDATVDASVKLYGPVAVMPGAAIKQGSMIFGPTVIGKKATIGPNALVINSVLWEGAELGLDCELRNCLVDSYATVRDGEVLKNRSILYEHKGLLLKFLNYCLGGVDAGLMRGQEFVQSKINKLNQKLPGWARSEQYNKYAFSFFCLMILFAAVMTVYWRPVLSDLWKIWRSSDEYSSGLLVPFLACYIVWSRRKEIIRSRIRPSAWGLLALLAAQWLRYRGLYYDLVSAERLSLIFTIAALILLLLGWQYLRKLAPVLIFLLLMLPFPYRVKEFISDPMQSWATTSAVFCLELVGYNVVQTGNIINLDSTQVAIAEACNGLRMVTAFFVIGGLVTLLVRRSWWEKLIMLLSSLPIALLCNTVRLAITAVAFTYLKNNQLEEAFHDFGGIAMMPLALGLMMAVFWVLTRIVTLEEEK